MATMQESNWNLEQLTDAEIYTAIRYLDPDAGSENKLDHFTAIVICIGVMLLVVLCLEFIWFSLPCHLGDNAPSREIFLPSLWNLLNSGIQAGHERIASRASYSVGMCVGSPIFLGKSSEAGGPALGPSR